MEKLRNVRKRRLIDVEPGSSVSEEQAHLLLAKKVKVKVEPNCGDKFDDEMAQPSTAKVKKKSTTCAAKKIRRPFKDKSNQETTPNYSKKATVKKEEVCTPPNVAKAKRGVKSGKISGMKKLRL